MYEPEILRVVSNWPEFYPKDIPIPPSDSKDTFGNYYRLVKFEPPRRDCFASTHEEQPNRHKRCRSLSEKQNVYGCSVFDNQNQAFDVRAKFPDALGERLISSGSFIPDDGKIKQTFSPGHHTVWLRVDAEPHTRFNIVPEASK